MICTVHYKLNARGNLAEFANDKPVTIKIIKVRDAFFKIDTAVIGKIPHDYIFVPDCWLDIGNSTYIWNGEYNMRVGS